VSTLAGVSSAGSTDGARAAARFNLPSSVAVDSGGNVYVADGNNSTIRKVTVAGVVTTLAGSAGQQGSADGVGAAARFETRVAWRWITLATSMWPTLAVVSSAR